MNGNRMYELFRNSSQLERTLFLILWGLLNAALFLLGSYIWMKLLETARDMGGNPSLKMWEALFGSFLHLLFANWLFLELYGWPKPHPSFFHGVGFRAFIHLALVVTLWLGAVGYWIAAIYWIGSLPLLL